MTDASVYPDFPANQVVDECASTNDLARALGERGLPEGTWVSARRQTQGRGRQGRAWVGEEGNLFLSMLARPTPAELRSHGTWIPLAVALRVAETLNRVFPAAGVTLKWPNDLKAGDAKLGGLLCEGTSAFVIVGVGLNCRDAPGDLDQDAVSLSAVCGARVEADQVRGAVVDAMRAALSDLRAHGPAGLAERFERLSALPAGTRVRWRPGAELRDGTVLGLGPFGELRVRTDEGREESLFAEEVSRIRAGS